MEPAARSTRLPPDQERQLVERARVDGAAFGTLYDFYLPRIYGYIHRRTGDHGVSEDLAAATFEKALGALRCADFRNEAFGGWLYRVAANAVVDHVRHALRVVPLDAPGAASAEAGSRAIGDDRATDEFAAALDRQDVREALRRLPEGHRRVLALRFYDDLEPDEICAVLGCSRATFAVKLHRALRALRGALVRESINAA